MVDEPWPLPFGWRWHRFDEVARVASNLVNPADFQDWPHIAPNHIESETGHLLPYGTVGRDGVTSPKHRFVAGNVLYSKIRPYLAKVVVPDFDGLCSADMYPIDCELDPRFLKWWMLTREFTRRAAGEQARTVLPKINVKSLSALPVPVTSLEDQRRIVEILEAHLSHLDAATRWLLSSRRRLTILEASALSEAREGELVALRDVAIIQGGIQKQPKRAPRTNAYPFLRVANVTSAGLDLADVHSIELFGRELDRLRLEIGDLLVVEGNGSASQIGRAALWDGSIADCVHQNHLIRVRPSQVILPEYLEAVWNSPENRRQLTDRASSSSGLHTLSVSKLSSLLIPIPSVACQLRAIGRTREIRDSRRRLEAEIDRAATLADRLRRSLLDSAFSGRLCTGTAHIEHGVEVARV